MVRLIADDLKQKTLWLRCALYGNYDLMKKPEDFSAIIGKYPSLFTYSDLSPYTICYKGKIQINLVSEDDGYVHNQTTDIRLGFDIANTTGADIAEAVSALIDTGIITEE